MANIKFAANGAKLIEGVQGERERTGSETVNMPASMKCSHKWPVQSKCNCNNKATTRNTMRNNNKKHAARKSMLRFKFVKAREEKIASLVDLQMRYSRD